MLNEVIAEHRGDWRATKAGRRLRLDRALLLIPGALDADQSGGEVDAIPGERLQLAAPQAGVEGRRPERTILGRRVDDERQGLYRGHDPGAATAHGRDLDAGCRVGVDVAVAQSTAADRPQRQQRVAHGRRVQPAGDQPVDEALNVTGADVLELRRAELRIDVFAQRLLVAA